MNTSYTLADNGQEWHLRQQGTQAVVSRYGCKRQALRESLEYVRGRRATLVLVPSKPACRN